MRVGAHTQSCFTYTVQNISKSSPQIRIKFAEYVEFATWTNQLDFDEDQISYLYDHRGSVEPIGGLNNDL